MSYCGTMEICGRKHRKFFPSGCCLQLTSLFLFLTGILSWGPKLIKGFHRRDTDVAGNLFCQLIILTSGDSDESSRNLS